MKIKYCFLFLLLFLVTSLKGQSGIGQFLEPVFPIEQKLQDIAGFGNVGLLSAGQIAQAFDQGGIKLSSVGASQMKMKVDQLEFVIFNPGSFPNAASIHSFFNGAGGVQISLAEAQNIYNHLNGGPKVGANAHVFVMSLIASRTNAMIQLFLQLLTNPKNPNSAAKRATAMKEAVEESGIDSWEFASDDIFDLDVHRIPARKEDPEHFHFDVRFLLIANGSEEYIVSEESHDLAWVRLSEIRDFTNEESILRMVEKTGNFI